MEKGRRIGGNFLHYKSDFEKNRCEAGGGG